MTLLNVIVMSSFLKNDEIFKDLIQTVGVYLTSFTVISGYQKKKIKKKSENDQSIGHFQNFFLLFFLVPSILNLKKNPVY